MRKNTCLKFFSTFLVISLIFSLTACKKDKTEVKTVADPFKAVTPKTSAEETMTAFNNETKYDYGKLDVEQYTVYSPTDEWQYAHGATIDYFDGTFYCVWGVSKVNEGDPGAHLMISTSKDGKEWSEPRNILDDPGYAPSGVQYQYGLRGLFYVDGKVVVSYRVDEMASLSVDENGLRKSGYGDEYIFNRGEFAVESSDGGKTWEQSDYCVGVAYTAQELNSGRKISWAGRYTDDLTLKNEWKRFSVDTSAAKADGATTVTEPSGFQTKDGTLRYFVRTNLGYLYGAESYDGGETWTKAYRTGFTNEDAMFKFGRLSDGRYYYIGNPVFNSNRFPLALLISEDGINFDQWYTIEDEIPTRSYWGGIYKSGYYGYPCVLEKDGYLYVAYSMNKETIAVSVIDISSIDKSKLVEKTPISEMFNSDLSNFKNATGFWQYSQGLGYTSNMGNRFDFSLSDTKLENEQSFVFETDITFLGDRFAPTKEFAGLVFGSSKSTQETVDFSKDSYYYLSLRLKGFSRIFSNDMGTVNGHGGDIPFTDDLKLLQTYNLKMELNAKTSMVDY